MAIGDTLITGLQRKSQGLADFASKLQSQGLNLDNPLVKLKFKQEQELHPLKLETERQQAGLANLRSIIAQRKDIRDEEKFKLDEEIKRIGTSLKLSEERRKIKGEERAVIRGKQLSAKTTANIKRTEALTAETISRMETREERDELIDFISLDSDIPISVAREIVTKRLSSVLAEADLTKIPNDIVQRVKSSIEKFNKRDTTKTPQPTPEPQTDAEKEAAFLKKMGLQ